MDLSAQQIKTLERLQSAGFQIVAFPLYANYVGVRKGNCAALLAPAHSGGFSMYSQPTLLISGNFTVRVRQGGRDFFVWKKERLEATAARLAELDSFGRELADSLLAVE